MKIAIYSRSGIVHRAGELEKLTGTLDKYGIRYVVNRGFAAEIMAITGRRYGREEVYKDRNDLPQDIGMLVAYGGDGTFLDCVRLLDARPIPVLGINSGRMGFLANVSKKDIDDAFAQVASGSYRVDERMLLHAEGDFRDPDGFPYAFNEFSIQKHGVTMIAVEAYVDNELVATYQGDGVILSTPVGSTAYALSVGGPIVSPDSRCFVLAPIASHNLTMRPLIVPEESILRFCVRTRSGKAVLTMDNREYEIEDGCGFTVSKAEKSAFLVRLQNISFYHTLRDKMMWGVDARDIVK